MWFTIKYLPGLDRALGSIPSTTGAVIHICNLSTLYLQMEHRQKNHLEACRPVSMEYLLILAESVGEILSQKQGGREQFLTAVLLPPHMFYGRFTCPHILRQQRGRGLWKVTLVEMLWDSWYIRFHYCCDRTSRPKQCMDSGFQTVHESRAEVAGSSS